MKIALSRIIHVVTVMIALWKLSLIKWHMALLELALRK